MKCVVFTGPTLPQEVAQQLLDAVYLPPASQGDVYRVACQRPQIIAIIDGYFERQPAVWHKEILWAMKEGIHVFGSASMGALRAAELQRFGMEGVGVIFEAYRAGHLEDDDEVTVTHGDVSVGYRALSDAMVNIRFTLAKAVALQVISSSTHDLIIGNLKGMFYPNRSFRVIIQQAGIWGVPPFEVEALSRWLPGNVVDQKREDAVAMLEAIKQRFGKQCEPKRVEYQFQHTEMWINAARHAGTMTLTHLNADGRITAEELLDELRVRGPDEWKKVRKDAMLRWFAFKIASQRDPSVSSEVLQDSSKQFRISRGLSSPLKFAEWLSCNDLTEDGFVRFLEMQVQLERFWEAASGELIDHIMDHLRERDEYSQLKLLLQEKRVFIEQAEWAGTPENGDRSEGEFIRWYFEQHLKASVPQDLNQYAADIGLSDGHALRRLIVGEYLYRRAHDGVALADRGAS